MNADFKLCNLTQVGLMNAKLKFCVIILFFKMEKFDNKKITNTVTIGEYKKIGLFPINLISFIQVSKQSILIIKYCSKDPITDVVSF